MYLHEIASPQGVRKQKRRVGRGHGSGRVKTAGKGNKGQNARSGGGVRLGFEGGQNPWTMRIPHKRGFNIGRFRKYVQVLNLSDLEKLFEAGATVDVEALRARGLVDHVKSKGPVKLLGNGTLSKALTIEVHSASRTAREAIAAAGGTLRLLTPLPEEAASELADQGQDPAANNPGLTAEQPQEPAAGE
jgi:large subunit ribosomal protein L15